MVSFAWSPNENGQIFHISGFIRAHGPIRAGALDAWFLNLHDRVTNKIKWNPCTCDSALGAVQDWKKHHLITEYLTESSSDGRNREFLRWDAGSSKLVPCDRMPNVSKGGRPPSKKPTKASDQTATVTGDGGSSAPPSADAPNKRRKTAQPAAGDGDSSAPPPKGRMANDSAALSDLEAIDKMQTLPMDTLRSVWSALCVGTVPTLPRTKEDYITQICRQTHPKTICKAVSNAAAFVAAAAAEAGGPSAQASGRRRGDGAAGAAQAAGGASARASDTTSARASALVGTTASAAACLLSTPLPPPAASAGSTPMNMTYAGAFAAGLTPSAAGATASAAAPLLSLPLPPTQQQPATCAASTHSQSFADMLAGDALPAASSSLPADPVAAASDKARAIREAKLAIDNASLEALTSLCTISEIGLLCWNKPSITEHLLENLDPWYILNALRLPGGAAQPAPAAPQPVSPPLPPVPPPPAQPPPAPPPAEVLQPPPVPATYS